jgi:hypothetical protein
MDKDIGFQRTKTAYEGRITLDKEKIKMLDMKLLL